MTAPLINRRTALGLIGAAATYPTTGRAAQFEQAQGRAFATDWQVTGPVGVGVSRLQAAFKALFEEIDAEMSPWRSDSAISRFNLAGTAEFAVTPEFETVTDAALHLARISDGAFDPTVGPLVSQWGFGPIRQEWAGDWRGIQLGTGKVRKSDAALSLDPCGIAKGRALDRAGALAHDMGFEDLLLDLGGELLALGHRASGQNWRVGIENPMTRLGPVAVLALPEGMAAATSGLSQNSYLFGGRFWGHIIDPHRAEPVDGALRSVTVVSTAAMHADGWATALFAAGPGRQVELAREHDIAAVFLFEEDGRLRQIATGGIADMLV